MNPLSREHLPNSLTLLRLVLAAAFFAVVAPYQVAVDPPWRCDVATVLFVVAAATDALDGHLARRWDVVSPFGRIMDPFCDKVLVLGAFVMLAGPGFALPAGGDATGSLAGPATGIASWMVVVILGRELLVTTARGYLESRGISFAAMAAGKWKMVLQSVAVPVVLVLAARPVADGADWALWTNRVLAWAVVLVTLWSGAPYLVALARLVRAGETSTPHDRPAPPTPPTTDALPDADPDRDRDAGQRTNADATSRETPDP